MAQQHIRHLFPGSNTAAGFVGFFENLRSQARRTVILKGGPGVGKSTLMKQAGAHFEKQGRPVGYFHCSGDPDSLDAVLAPDVGFLILDGTAPHVVDPRTPGARDGILNLGVCLDENQLSEQSGEIQSLFGQIAGHYARAYRYLSCALTARQDAAAVYDAAVGDRERRRLAAVLSQLLPDGPEGGESRFFAQAVTWKGVLQEMDSVLTDAVICLDLPWGFDADGLLLSLWRAAEMRGMERVGYFDPLNAAGLAHVNLGGTVFTTAVAQGFPVYAPQMDQAALRRESSRLSFDRAVHDLCLNQAVECLGDAKAAHDALERYYVDAMDYSRLDEIKADFIASLP